MGKGVFNHHNALGFCDTFCLCVWGGEGGGQNEIKLSVVGNKRRSSFLRRENFKVV